jgi:hypothetical protein
MLADIEVWLLGKASADMNADMEAYRQVVCHSVLSLPAASVEGHCVATDAVDLRLWLQRGATIMQQVGNLEGRNVAEETENVIE